MLLPPLCSQTDYVNFAHGAGLKTLAEPFDISKQVSKTWLVSARNNVCDELIIIGISPGH